MNTSNDWAMTSQRPYLLRAMWEWIADNGMTAHLLVDATYPGVRVPRHTVKEGKVVLNIADRAVAKLQMGNEDIAFSARFSGVTHAIIVPMGAVLAIYTRETGQGMAMPPEAEYALDDVDASDSLSAVTEADDNGDEADSATASANVTTLGARAGKASSGGGLSVVSSADADNAKANSSPTQGSLAIEPASAGDGDDGDDSPPSGSGKRPQLRVVK